MTELETAIHIVEIILAAIAIMALGDYLGHKVGRRRLATVLGIATLTVIVAFVIYAAITLR